MIGIMCSSDNRTRFCARLAARNVIIRITGAPFFDAEPGLRKARRTFLGVDKGAPRPSDRNTWRTTRGLRSGTAVEGLASEHHLATSFPRQSVREASTW